MSLPDNLSILQTRIAQATQQARRGADTVRLMAVSKGVDSARLQEALNAGQRLFGENYVQEARAKWEGLRAAYPDAELHLIGPLQTNKAKDAVKLFDAIDTLDRPSLAEALAKAMIKTGRRIPLCIEINIAAEPQKHGCAPADLPALLATSRALKLDVRGLMCVPPADKDAAPYFRELAALAYTHGLNELSMGMSADFESAIHCGATIVRLGTALFGARN